MGTAKVLPLQRLGEGVRRLAPYTTPRVPRCEPVVRVSIAPDGTIQIEVGSE